MAVKLILLHAFIACTVDLIANGLDVIHGRYTRDIHNYEVAIPHQLTPSGDFLTYRLPSHYQHQYSSERNPQQRRRRRDVHRRDMASIQDNREPVHVHYGVPIKGKVQHLELWPNHGLVAPNAVVEYRRARDRVQDRTIRKLAGRNFCHYTGQVRGDPKSKVALTTCGGLAGYVTTEGKRYFIEPVFDHEENQHGQLMHVVYESEPHGNDKRNLGHGSQFNQQLYGTADVDPNLDEHSEEMRVVKSTPYCGTTKNWADAWKSRFRTEELAAVSKAAKASAAASSPGGSTLGGQLPWPDVNAFRASWSSSDIDDDKSEAPRGLQSVHRYLETLVVADKKFLEHHKDTDYDTYVMTIMNMVSDYYHDASSGNQMDVVVVRLIYLEKEEEEIDLEISADADKTLASFCKWQQKVNPEDIHNPNHHDIAVLLTRYDICADNLTSCGLMGLAYVASACTKDKPCAINEDSGLILGIVVAHEMGHVMGCAHDSEEESGCTPQAEDESYHIMSPFVHQHTTKWSTCSRTFITTLFDNDLGECLNDAPEISLYDGDNTMLSGTVYDATYQCQMAYPGSKVCQTDPDKFCTILLCRTDPDTCLGNGEPPADGTKCGENKWCYNKKCVEIGERPDAINGGWGEWGTWSSCSRTCGGGITYSERDCNNPQPQHNGRYCIGDRRKVKICNTNACSENDKSFRAQQCESHNTKPFNGVNYTWTPYLKEENPCVLYCINEESIFAKLDPRCKDGTKCKMGTKNTCVAGVCRIVGCDFVLDSDAVEDECGECRGDGTTCKLVSKTFDGPPGHGYVKVGVIFKGCRNILIEETGPSDNTLAIKNADETVDFLNGNYTEGMDGMRDIGGSQAIYTHPEPNKEMLLIHGPLQEDIVLYVVFYEKKNVGYSYKYAEPSTKQASYQPTYHWEFIEWGECSARCGGGSEIAEAQCVEERAGKVANSFCPQTERPQPKSRVCNEMHCLTRWRVGKWSICRPCKGQSGIRSREVECIREAKRPGTEDVLVEDDLCSGKKPGSKEVCQSKLKCTSHEGKLHREVDDAGTMSGGYGILGTLKPEEVSRQMWLHSFGPLWNYAGLKMEMLPKSFDDRNVQRIVHKTPGTHIVCVPLNKTHKMKKPSKYKGGKEKIQKPDDAESKDKDKEENAGSEKGEEGKKTNSEKDKEENAGSEKGEEGKKTDADKDKGENVGTGKGEEGKKTDAEKDKEENAGTGKGEEGKKTDADKDKGENVGTGKGEEGKKTDADKDKGENVGTGKGEEGKKTDADKDKGENVGTGKGEEGKKTDAEKEKEENAGTEKGEEGKKTHAEKDKGENTGSEKVEEGKKTNADKDKGENAGTGNGEEGKKTDSEGKGGSKNNGKEDEESSQVTTIAEPEKSGHKNEKTDGKATGGSSDGSKSKVDLKPGSIAHDPIPEDAIKEISVHVKQSHGSLNLSDDAFEAMGDKVPDTLDFVNMQVATGEKAAHAIKEHAHANRSMEHNIINR